MKIHTLPLLVLLCAALMLSACGETLPAPQDTPVPPTALPATEAPAAEPPPTEAPTPTQPAPTEAAPTETAAQPDQPPATEAPAPTQAAPTQPAAGPLPAASSLPVAGQWVGGSGNDLIVSFIIGRSGAQASLSHLGILWFGRDECSLNQVIETITTFSGPEFSRTFNGYEAGYTLNAQVVSENLIEGTLELHVDGCGSHDFNWRAIPKPAP